MYLSIPALVQSYGQHYAAKCLGHEFFILKRVLHDLISIQCAVEATGYYNIEHQFLSMHAQMPKQSAHCC